MGDRLGTPRAVYIFLLAFWVRSSVQHFPLYLYVHFRGHFPLTVTPYSNKGSNTGHFFVSVYKYQITKKESCDIITTFLTFSSLNEKWHQTNKFHTKETKNRKHDIIMLPRNLLKQIFRTKNTFQVRWFVGWWWGKTRRLGQFPPKQQKATWRTKPSPTLSPPIPSTPPSPPPGTQM